MQLYEELVARGLIAQVTDEDEIREMINAGKATFYIHREAGPHLPQKLHVVQAQQPVRVVHHLGLALAKLNKPLHLLFGSTQARPPSTSALTALPTA